MLETSCFVCPSACKQPISCSESAELVFTLNAVEVVFYQLRTLTVPFCMFVSVFRYVCIAMEALDQLLMACHCQSINLFVESFLKMVRKLLESDKPSLQILGTNSVSLS